MRTKSNNANGSEYDQVAERHSTDEQSRDDGEEADPSAASQEATAAGADAEHEERNEQESDDGDEDEQGRAVDDHDEVEEGEDDQADAETAEVGSEDDARDEDPQDSSEDDEDEDDEEASSEEREGTPEPEPESTGLIWCRNGCGRSIHASCWSYWSKHQRQSGVGLRCLLCRRVWEEEDCAEWDLSVFVKHHDYRSSNEE